MTNDDGNLLRCALLDQVCRMLNFTSKIVREKVVQQRTGICLDTGGDFSGTDIIKVCDVLTEYYSLQITLSQTLSVNLSGVYPDIHVQEGTRKRPNT